MGCNRNIAVMDMVVGHGRVAGSGVLVESGRLVETSMAAETCTGAEMDIPAEVGTAAEEGMLVERGTVEDVVVAAAGKRLVEPYSDCMLDSCCEQALELLAGYYTRTCRVGTGSDVGMDCRLECLEQGWCMVCTQWLVLRPAGPG